MADEIIIETTSQEVVEIGVVGPQGPQGAAGTGLETLTSKGDTLYRGDVTGERLPIGTSGQILRVSASGLPEWGAAPASGVSSVSGKTGAVSLDSTDIFTEQALQISDAGTADCNGVFVYGGLFNGRPTYYATKDTFVYWDGSNWVINHNGDDQYFGTATTHPWQAVWSFGDGANPLPVVTQAASHEFEQVVGQRTNPTALGTASSKNVGTGANDVAAGNHTHSAATQSVAGFLSTTDKTKLDGIATGAEVNVNADWNASSGDAQILNKPTSLTPSAHAASHHAAAGSDALAPSDIGAQSIFTAGYTSASVSGVPLQLSAARARTWTLENAQSNRNVYLPVTGIQTGDVAVLIGGGDMSYTLTVKVPAAGGAAIIDPENTPNASPVVISASGQQFRFIVTDPSSFNPWRFVSVDTHTHPASAISDSTTAGRALLTGADSSAQRSSLGLGTASTKDAPATGNASSTQVVLGNDTRLSDARTPSSTLAHAASHAAGGSDPVTPSSIGAQSIFDSSSVFYSSDQTLAVHRARQWTISNTNAAGINVTLPSGTDGSLSDDIYVIRGGSAMSGPITIRHLVVSSPQIYETLATISATGQQYRFRSDGGTTANWSLVPVDTHTHGNITNDGKVGSDAGRVLVTTTAGAVTTLALGTANQVLRVNSGATAVEFTSLAASATTDTTNASNISSGTLATARMGSGTPSASNYLRGDGSWQTVTAGVGGSTGATDNVILRSDGTGGTSVQDSAFVIPDNATASPNNTVNHASIQATGGTTNVSVSLVPKGTGAFSLSVPDSAATGGNVRGVNSVDLQRNRSAATQVASGPNSVIGGGQNNTNAGELCFIGGGQNNSHSTSGQYACVIGGGINNLMSSIAEYSTIAGGRGNACNSNGQTATIAGGSFNTASNYFATIGGGTGNTGSGEYSVVAGGRTNTASTDFAYVAGGFLALANRYGIQAHAAGQFAAQGDAQRIRAVLRCATTTNAAVEMALNGSTTYLTIPSGKVMYGEIYVVGVRAGGADVAIYRVVYAAKNIGGTSTEVFSSVTTDAATGTSLEVATVDQAGAATDYIRIRPTGVAGQNWRWVAKVDMVEVGHG